jgi:hypothetical protein
MKSFQSLKLIFSATFWLISSSLIFAQTIEPIFNPTLTPIAIGSSDSAKGEGIENVIDGSKDRNNKYLTFDKTSGLNFYVNTGVMSVVKSLTITTANDFPERDPTQIKIYGRVVEDGTASTDTNPAWTLIRDISFLCTELATGRNADYTALLDNVNGVAFNSYWVGLYNACDEPEANSLQISEVQLQGYFNPPPAITYDAVATGGAEVGKEITVAYNYTDALGEVESGTTFQWYFGSVAIEGATTITYTPTTDDLGKILKVKVTPSDGTFFGEPIFPVIGVVASCPIGDACETQNLISDQVLCDTNPLSYEAVIQRTTFADFDISEQRYVNLNILEPALTASNRSIFMWIKKSADVDGDPQVLFSINTDNGRNQSSFQITDDQKLGIDNGAFLANVKSDALDNDWHHVGYTYAHDGNDISIYIDGVLVQTSSKNHDAEGGDLYSLGQYYDRDDLTSFYDGYMAEVSVWNEILDASEIDLIMKGKIATTHPKYSNLVAYYPMRESEFTATVLKDESPSGNNGVVSGDIQDVNFFANISAFNAIGWYDLSWQKD